MGTINHLPKKREGKIFILYSKWMMGDHLETMTFILKEESLSSKPYFPYLYPMWVFFFLLDLNHKWHKKYKQELCIFKLLTPLRNTCPSLLQTLKTFTVYTKKYN